MIRKILAITAITLLSVSALKSQTPHIRLRADSLGSDLDQGIWRNLSGGSSQGIFSGQAEEIRIGSLNYNPAIMMSGSMHISLDSIVAESGDITVMLVYQALDSLNEENVWQICDTTFRSLSGQTTQRIIDRYGGTRFGNSNSMQAVVSTQTQKITGTSSAYSLNLGTFDTLPSCGKIAEVLLFSGIEHDSITKVWEAYLAVKYGITLYGRSYYSSGMDSIWSYSGNESLSGQVIGIGRDGHFGLSQKQSITPDGKIIFGAFPSSLQEASGENNTEIENLQFIVLGIDTAAFKEKTEIYLENGFSLTKYGDFRVQKTGTQAIPTFLEISYSDFDIDTANLTCLHLLINRSGEEYGENTGFYPLESIDTASKTLIFKNIYWDTDRSGSDKFCISVLTPDSIMNHALLNSESPSDSLLAYLESIYKNTGSDFPRCPGCLASGDNISSRSHKGNIPDDTTSPLAATVYPNPSTGGHFELDIRFAEKTDASVSIVSPEGKVMETRNIKGATVSKELFDIKSKGEYHIVIRAGVHEQSIKIVII